MSSTTGIGIIIAGVIIIGGAIFFLSTGQTNMASESAMEDQVGEKMESDEVMATSAMQEIDDAMKSSDDAMMDDGAMMERGSYEAYTAEKIARAESGDVVLFFRARWCPTCKALDADIRAHSSSIPAGLTILDVDYDDSAALKQKYGVTYQHTLVQVNARGAMVKKWSGSPTLAALVLQLQ